MKGTSSLGEEATTKPRCPSGFSLDLPRTIYENKVPVGKSSSKAQIAAYLLRILAMAERGGLYCSFFRNSLVFCHFVRKTLIFCRFRPSLSSRIRLSSALQSLQWTSKVPKKSNISNKLGFPSYRIQAFAAKDRPVFGSG
jgi:hypothetical protein